MHRAVREAVVDLTPQRRHELVRIVTERIDGTKREIVGTAVGQQVRVSQAPGPGVSRRVELGDYSDGPVCCVVDEIADGVGSVHLILGVRPL